MKRNLLALMAVLATIASTAQPKFSMPHGLYDEQSINVTITPTDASAEVYYTTDGSTPTAASTRYASPLTLSKTTLLRAIEVIGGNASAITTASYVFVTSVLSQPNNPEGYPAEWGQYTQSSGTAVADYEMDPEMTSDPVLRPKIIEGLKQIPILSVVTDKGNLFNKEPDENTGGIYIFTGPPVGDNTGNGWTRQCSAELFGGPQNHDFTIDCGLKLHGGHGRLAEKNPKHSFRLQFKKAYGPASLEYPLFGSDEPKKFDQLVLRCHFGNAWQHWAEGNRQKAQYTRDVWARRMQRKLGHTGVNALYVHLFLNGMYWGLYNIAERVDDNFGKEHFGGKKKDYDVIKIEEEGGNHIEASEGTLDSWYEMIETVNAVAGQSKDLTPEAAYEKLDTLLDKDNFIDYMIINQYAGNTDWDHHNWYAIRRNNTNKEGFKFLCWDSEIIFENANENVVTKRNSGGPTDIFNKLLTNDDFSRRYLKRAKELLADEGLLGETSVVAVWDSLYNNISMAIYDEAARWGDYRRDVPNGYGFGNTLYTVDETYMAERNRLKNQYFPTRTATVLSQITKYVDIDDFVVPENWEKLTANMYYWWDSTGADASPISNANVNWNLNQDVSNGGVVAGLVSVEHDLFADISQYDKLVLRGNGGTVRILANRLVAHGEWKEIAPSFNENDPYWNTEYDALVIPLEDFKTKNTTKNNPRVDTFVHLDAIKANNGSTVNVKAIYLVPKDGSSNIDIAKVEGFKNNKYYNLQGQPVAKPTKGLYILNGKKVLVK
ncbi:MAG: CotH kinase family protein [Prevotella sp.]|nr:CotH kinase family protein [Prevotella sp.]